MKTLESIFERLKKPGIRLTPIRKATVGLLFRARKPLCVEGIGNRLVGLGLSPNKTTLYRELGFLMGEGFVHEFDFGGGRKCYEWNRGHHHHLICRKCRAVEEVDAHDLEESFGSFEKRLGQKSRFSDLGHALEFYGLCKKCQ